jgi:hypothetical protein
MGALPIPLGYSMLDPALSDQGTQSPALQEVKQEGGYSEIAEPTRFDQKPVEEPGSFSEDTKEAFYSTEIAKLFPTVRKELTGRSIAKKIMLGRAHGGSDDAIIGELAESKKYPEFAQKTQNFLRERTPTEIADKIIEQFKLPSGEANYFKDIKGRYLGALIVKEKEESKKKGVPFDPEIIANSISKDPKFGKYAKEIAKELGDKDADTVLNNFVKKYPVEYTPKEDKSITSIITKLLGSLPSFLAGARISRNYKLAGGTSFSESLNHLLQRKIEEGELQWQNPDGSLNYKEIKKFAKDVLAVGGEGYAIGAAGDFAGGVYKGALGGGVLTKAGKLKYKTGEDIENLVTQKVLSPKTWWKPDIAGAAIPIVRGGTSKEIVTAMAKRAGALPIELTTMGLAETAITGKVPDIEAMAKLGGLLTALELSPLAGVAFRVARRRMTRGGDYTKFVDELSSMSVNEIRDTLLGEKRKESIRAGGDEKFYEEQERTLGDYEEPKLPLDEMRARGYVGGEVNPLLSKFEKEKPSTVNIRPDAGVEPPEVVGESYNAELVEEFPHGYRGDVERHRDVALGYTIQQTGRAPLRIDPLKRTELSREASDVQGEVPFELPYETGTKKESTKTGSINAFIPDSISDNIRQYAAAPLTSVGAGLEWDDENKRIRWNQEKAMLFGGAMLAVKSGLRNKYDPALSLDRWMTSEGMKPAIKIGETIFKTDYKDFKASDGESLTSQIPKGMRDKMVSGDKDYKQEVGYVNAKGEFIQKNKVDLSKWHDIRVKEVEQFTRTLEAERSKETVKEQERTELNQAKGAANTWETEFRVEASKIVDKIGRERSPELKKRMQEVGPIKALRQMGWTEPELETYQKVMNLTTQARQLGIPDELIFKTWTEVYDSKRMDIKSPEQGGGVQLYSGIPIDEIIKRGRRFLSERFKSNIAEQIGLFTEKGATGERWLKLANENWESRVRGVKNELRNSGLGAFLEVNKNRFISKEEISAFMTVAREGWPQIVEFKDTSWANRNTPGSYDPKVYAITVPGKHIYTAWHFDGSSSRRPFIPNVIGHLRVSKIKNKNGEVGLLLETMQSDMGQEAYARGFEGESIPGGALKQIKEITGFDTIEQVKQREKILEEEVNKVHQEINRSDVPLTYYNALQVKLQNLQAELVNLERALLLVSNPIPKGPYGKVWNEAMLRFSLDIATGDKDVKWVGWPDGNTQATRWGKGKWIDRIEWDLKKVDDKIIQGNITTWDRKEKNGDSWRPLYAEDIEWALGSEYGGRIVKELNEKGKSSGDVSPEKFVSGEYLRTLYDKKQVKYAENLLAQYGMKMNPPENVMNMVGKGYVGAFKGDAYKTTERDVKLEDVMLLRQPVYGDELTPERMKQVYPDMDKIPYRIHNFSLPEESKARINERGISLYSGVPWDMNFVKDIIGKVTGGWRKVELTKEEKKIFKDGIEGKLPDTVDTIFKERELVRKVQKEREKIDLEEWKKKAVRYGWDTSGNLRAELIKTKEGQRTYYAKNLATGSSSSANMISEFAYDNIYGDRSMSELALLDDIILSRTIINIDDRVRGGDKTIKHPFGTSGPTHQKYLDVLKSKIGDRKFKELWKASDEFFQVMRGQLEDGFDAGLYTPEAFKKLYPLLYSRREFIDHIDPDSGKSVVSGGRKLSLRDSGLYSLQEGSYGEMELNTRKLMLETINRTQTRVFKNKANLSLYEFAKANPDNGFVIPLEERYINGKVIDNMPKGWEKVNFFLGGKETFMAMEKDMANEWVTSNPEVSGAVGEFFNIISGAKLLKAVATGYNPAFALTNMPRDIMLVWALQGGHEYSAFMPKYSAQMTLDFAKTFTDTWFRKGSYVDYIMEGGGQELLSSYGRLKGASSKSTLGDVLGYVGMSSELWTRLAVRDRVINNRLKELNHKVTPAELKEIQTEATAISRDYLDFRQGGTLSKGWDKAFPYFNASVIATRNLLREGVANKALTSWKFAQLGVLTMGLYVANLYNNPEAVRHTEDTDRARNFIVNLPESFSYIDDKGEKRHLQFRIAKEQGVQVVSSLFNALMDRYFFGTIPSDELIESWKNLINTNVLPPTIAAYLTYANNKDFWTNNDAWRGDKFVAPSEQYRIGRTHPLSIALGKLTAGNEPGGQISPDKLSAALQRIIPASNLYVSLGLGGYKVLSGDMTEDMKSKTIKQVLTEIPAVRRVFASTHPYSEWRESNKQFKVKAATIRQVETRTIDNLVEKMMRMPEIQRSAGEDAIDNFIDSIEPFDKQKGLRERAERHQELWKIPNRTWWVDLSLIKDPETKAEMYYDRFKKVSPKERNEMEDLLYEIKGINSERFQERLGTLEDEFPVK